MPTFSPLFGTRALKLVLLAGAALALGSGIPPVAETIGVKTIASTTAGTVAPANTVPVTPQQYFSSASSASSRWGKDYLPNLPVLDQDGQQFNFYDDLIAGKNVVINFIYTTCNDICPLTTARMALVQEKLGDAVGRDVFMYSISIDPENDRPEQLKNYAEAFRIGPGWKLLTGKAEDIAQIRYKLGERSRVLKEHRHEMLIGNAETGSWSKDSAFGDIERVVINIRSLDRNWRYEPPKSATNAGQRQFADGAIDVGYKPGEALFIKACSTCHTIGKGDKVGPDLKAVSARRTQDWLTGFISRPDKVFERKDPVALAMLKQYKGIRMPNLGLSEQDAGDVLAYINAQTYIEASAAAGHVHDHAKHVAEEAEAHAAHGAADDKPQVAAKPEPAKHDHSKHTHKQK
jgi:protein SCO1